MAGADGQDLLRGPEVTDPVSTVTIPLPHNDEIAIAIEPMVGGLPEISVNVPCAYTVKVERSVCGRLWVRMVPEVTET